MQQRVASLESELGTEKERASALNSDLDSALTEYQQKEQVLLEKIEDRSIITISEAMLFSSGSVQLTQTATDILDKVGEVTSNYPDREIRVEGHTDNVGIALEFQDRFKSNWELSTARAYSALKYLQDNQEVDVKNINIAGFGDTHPIAPNDTPEGRTKNRRVEFVFFGK